METSYCWTFPLASWYYRIASYPLGSDGRTHLYSFEGSAKPPNNVEATYRPLGSSDGVQNDTVRGNENYPDFDLDLPEDAQSEDDKDDDDDDINIRIETKSQEFIKNVNDTVILPCKIVGNNNHYVLMWRKDKNFVISQDKTLNSIKNMRQLSNGSLEISPIVEDDDGSYQCSALLTEKIRPSVTHRLKVKAPPRITNLTAKNNITVLKIGESLELTCKAIGYPEPHISWHKGDERLVTEGGVFRNEKIHHRDAGMYRCLADNKVGEPAFQSVEIKIEFKPIVTIEELSVSSDNNVDAELQCVVLSEPKSRVVWKKDNVNIVNNERMQVTHKEHAGGREQKYILRINHLEESDYGRYTCMAANSVGETEKHIRLKVPVIVRFVKPQSESKHVTLSWEVRSKGNILEHELQYRKKGTEDWKVAKPEVSEPKNDIYLAKHILKGLEPGLYETRLRSQNNHGWSEYSDIVSFEGVFAKHGHHKHPKTGHKDSKEKHITTPSQEAAKQDVISPDDDVPAQQQENKLNSDKATKTGASESSGCSLTPSTVPIISVILLAATVVCCRQ